MLERPTTCKFGAPTKIGIKFSSSRMSTSSILKTRNLLMSSKQKMKKVKESKFMAKTMELTRDGRFCMLMNKRRLQLKVKVKNSVLKSIEHSTSSPDYQCTELLNVKEPTTFGLRDIERMLLHNSSTSTMSPRLSDHNNGRTMPWQSNPMVIQPTSDLHQVSIQDGGRCSECKTHTLLTRKERSWIF